MCEAWSRSSARQYVSGAQGEGMKCRHGKSSATMSILITKMVSAPQLGDVAGRVLTFIKALVS